jgi:hypothetical protein
VEILFDPNLNSVRVLNGAYAGVAFDPTRDLLYLADSATNQIVGYDTANWNEQFRLAIGETIGAGQEFGNGVMTVSDDGSRLFLSTPSGVRMLTLPAPTTLGAAIFLPAASMALAPRDAVPTTFEQNTFPAGFRPAPNRSVSPLPGVIADDSAASAHPGLSSGRRWRGVPSKASNATDVSIAGFLSPWCSDELDES